MRTLSEIFCARQNSRDGGMSRAQPPPLPTPPEVTEAPVAPAAAARQSADQGTQPQPHGHFSYTLRRVPRLEWLYLHPHVLLVIC